MRADQALIKGAPRASEGLLLEADAGASRIRARGGQGSGIIACEPELWMAFFFDGTNNSEEPDRPEFKHTNVARLYRAHLDNDAANQIFRVYFPGVGSAFKDELTGEEDKGGTLGSGFGAGGIMRLNCALEHLKSRIRAAESQSPTRKIRQIHVAIFGFSRGAALARAFARMLEAATRLYGFDSSEPRWWQGAHPHPFRVYFMGLFDTVASVDTPTSLRTKTRAAVAAAPLVGPIPAFLAATADGHGSWASDLRIPSSRLVKRCVHFVAAHELRLSFPVDLVMEKGRLPPNCVEILYPGVHSDVGGGYRPGEQGRGKPKDDTLKLCQIPLHHMFLEAWAAGVPLRNPALSDAKTGWTSRQTADFDLDPQVVRLYNTYLGSLAPLGPGREATLQAWIEAHMGAYYRWRVTVLDQDPPPDRSSKKDPDKQSFIEGVRTHNARFREDAEKAWREGSYASPYLRKLAEAWGVYRSLHPPAVSPAANAQSCLSGGSSSKPAPMSIFPPLQAAPVIHAPSAEVCSFFQDLVHDSVADFRRDKLVGKGTTPTDDSRLSFPRVFYHGGDDRAKIAKNELDPQREAAV